MKKGILFVSVFFISCIFSVAQVKYVKGMDFDDENYAIVPKKAKLTRSLESVPTTVSLKQFTPFPKTQGQFGTCAAWASAYCGRTMVEAIKNNWTDRELITSKAFSPAFLFRMLKPTDAECKGGATISSAFEIMKDKGLISYTSLGVTCTPTIMESQLADASNHKIKDYLRLFDQESSSSIKIQSVKKSISESKPVVFGMICPPSFGTAKGVWNPIEAADRSFGGHAMCVVGYDDNKEGGAFEIQNSWGNYWGNEGYIWIKYADFAKYTMYAYEFIDLPAPRPETPDLSGSLRLALADGTSMPSNLLISTRGLTVVPAKTAPGPLSLYRTAQPYTSGTRFRIYISNNQPAYVYAISTDLSNEITKIFPYEEGISAALTDKKNDVAIPDEDHFIEFDNKPGKDFLCVLYSKTALNINEIISKIAAQQGDSFSKKVFAVIGNQMVEPKNIQFSTNNISFTGFSRGKSIVAMMVELEHK
jgi:Papain family cysteine protease/Domain of unknown function (DUF4384)